MYSFPIKPSISPEQSASRITNKNAVNMGKLESQVTVVQPFSPKHAFSHHGGITLYKGKIYAMWSSGEVDEDGCGQRVMWSYTDGFSDWKKEMPLSDTQMGEHSLTVKFAQGFFSTPDRLYAYFLVSEYKPELLLGENVRPRDVKADTPAWLYNKRFCCYLLEDGVSWSEPVEAGFGGFNHSCEPMLNGRYGFAMGTGVRYTDKIEKGKVPELISSYVNNESILDAKTKGAVEMCEASFYFTDDGIMHLLMRSGEYRLWHAESYDNGTTFTDVYPTNFSDDLAKFQFGRLPDGRFFYVGNSVAGQRRLPLMLAISEDGYNFDKEYIIRDEPVELKQEGLYKGGHYGYPECAILDGYMYIIYSKQKEEMEITRFSLDQLK